MDISLLEESEQRALKRLKEQLSNVHYEYLLEYKEMHPEISLWTFWFIADNANHNGFNRGVNTLAENLKIAS